MYCRRVSHASVAVKKPEVSLAKIDLGLLALFVGIGPNDTEKEVVQMCDKIAGLRIFEDDQRKMNLSLLDVQGEIFNRQAPHALGRLPKGTTAKFYGCRQP